MELTSEAIREVEFREKLRGYHPDDVDAFVERVAATVDDLTRRVREFQAAQRDRDPDAPSEETIRRTLLMAQRTADMVLAEANESAAKTRAEAQAEADALLADANDNLQRSIDEAQRRFESDLARLEAARATLQQDVSMLDDYVTHQRAVLRDALVQQLQLLDKASGEQLDPAPTVHDVEPLLAGPPGAPVESAPAVAWPEHPVEAGVSPEFSAAGDAPLSGDDQATLAPAPPAPPAPLSGEAWTNAPAPAASVLEQPGALAEVPPASPSALDEVYDVFARGRDVARVPSDGEDDPFLAELRRAVADPGSSGELGAEPTAPPVNLVREPSLPSPLEDDEREPADELRGMPEGGKMAGRLFRRR